MPPKLAPATSTPPEANFAAAVLGNQRSYEDDVNTKIQDLETNSTSQPKSGFTAGLWTRRDWPIDLPRHHRRQRKSLSLSLSLTGSIFFGFRAAVVPAPTEHGGASLLGSGCVRSRVSVAGNPPNEEAAELAAGGRRGEERVGGRRGWMGCRRGSCSGCWVCWAWDTTGSARRASRRARTPFFLGTHAVRMIRG
mmetsp:Transcript_4792/g.14984  ORF Transcript_4792/g.14984 Transcript_4792/m.14984 type:complete len:194 (+) Transcript_4792:205-786(+)